MQEAPELHYLRGEHVADPPAISRYPSKRSCRCGTIVHPDLASPLFKLSYCFARLSPQEAGGMRCICDHHRLIGDLTITQLHM